MLKEKLKKIIINFFDVLPYLFLHHAKQYTFERFGNSISGIVTTTFIEITVYKNRNILKHTNPKKVFCYRNHSPVVRIKVL